MKKYIVIILFLLAGILTFQACLKDDHPYWPNDVSGKQYITIYGSPLNVTAVNQVRFETVLPVATLKDTVTFFVNLASDAVPSTATTVTFALDNTLITAYDTSLYQAAVAAHDTVTWGVYVWNDYKPYPGVKLITPTITIPAGSRVGYAKILVDHPDTLRLNVHYMAAFKITGVSPSSISIAQNLSSVLCAFPIANQYEGDYTVVGYRKHPSLGTLVVNKTEHLSTVDANTVTKSGFGDYPYDVQIQVTNNVLVVQGVNCFKVNVTVWSSGSAVASAMETSWVGDPAAAPKPPLDPTWINYYNPFTKTFVLNAHYNLAAPRYMYEVLTLQ